MIVFFIILISAVLVLYLNLRKVASGNKGVLVASLPIILTLGSFFLARQNFVLFSAIQTFMVIWICQALWMFILWDLFCLGRFIFRKVRAKKGYLQYKTNTVRNGIRIIFVVSILFSLGILAYGIPNNGDYKTRVTNVDVNIKLRDVNQRRESETEKNKFILASEKTDFSAVFFSDLHLDPLFSPEKLERLIVQCDSIRPDFVLFGGDLADVHDSILTAKGYDKLIMRLAATAKVAAVGIGGNHEVYMENDGSDPAGFLRRNGWIVLEDSTVCLPGDNPVACLTGRMDFQKARVINESRRSLSEIFPVGKQDSLVFVEHQCPWIVLDHQPKGINEKLDVIPDIALSGHTHDGQFFPGNIVINWVWRLAYGEGVLDGVRWLVSSGINSWGPPVRAGSDTEIWILNFKVFFRK